MENCNCHHHHDYCECHPHHINWENIFGDICSNHDLMKMLERIKHSIAWENLIGNIRLNDDLMDLLDDLKKHGIEWSNIRGNVEHSRALINKILELIDDFAQGSLFTEEFFKRMIKLLDDILNDILDCKEKEIWDKLKQVILKYFAEESKKVCSPLFKKILDGIATQLDAYGNSECDDLIERFLRKLWTALLKYLEKNPDLIDKLLEILMDRLLELLKDPSNPLYQKILNLMKEILSKLKLGDIGDVNNNYESISADDKYEYHLEYNPITKQWVASPYAWYGKVSEYNSLDELKFGITYYAYNG